MAHKTLIGGTAYEISGGKTLVGGTTYSIDKGKTLVGGTAYEVGFGGPWPSNLNTCLEFASASAFTLKVNSICWNGTMEYCNGDGWKAWNGSEISSGETESGHRIYLRGIGNKKVIGSSSGRFYLTGSNIECNGNIENLLDYATVAGGSHPNMADSCFSFMFYNQTTLIKAPSLPATTLTTACYFNMFSGCTALTAIPRLPATTLVNSCYLNMFEMCMNIKVSTTQTSTYTKAYRIPSSGAGTAETGALDKMFRYTGGAFTGTPEINTTYYLDSSNEII